MSTQPTRVVVPLPADVNAEIERRQGVERKVGDARVTSKAALCLAMMSSGRDRFTASTDRMLRDHLAEVSGRLSDDK